VSRQLQILRPKPNGFFIADPAALRINSRLGRLEIEHDTDGILWLCSRILGDTHFPIPAGYCCWVNGIYQTIGAPKEVNAIATGIDPSRYGFVPAKITPDSHEIILDATEGAGGNWHVQARDFPTHTRPSGILTPSELLMEIARRLIL
jgi:hypothetical protein